MTPDDRILVIIPTHDEEAALPGVLDEIQAAIPGASVVVVDDGSTDRSARIALERGAAVQSHPVNLGYGAALVTGYRYALDQGYSWAVTMDADGQHIAAEIPGLVQAARRAGADVVVGARNLASCGYKPAFPRRVGIRLFAVVGRWLTHADVQDPTSGFRLMNRRALEFLAENTPRDYPDVNVRIALHRFGFHVVETPVQMRERTTGRSMLRGTVPFRYVPVVTWYILRICMSTRGAPKAGPVASRQDESTSADR